MSEKQYSEGMYSTGEIAKECGVTVRTVQYYDSRGLLIPSELTEGGRRMYSEEDVKKLKFLTYLRSLGLSIDDIGRIIKEDNSRKVLAALLEEQARSLSSEINEKRGRLKEVKGFLSMLRSSDIGESGEVRDIAKYMRKRSGMKRFYLTLTVVGIVLGVIEWSTAILWITTGTWQPFAAGMTIVIAASVLFTVFYYRKVRYICPECQTTFKARFGEFFFSAHTLRTRRLTCPHCGKKSFCIETFHEEDEK